MTSWTTLVKALEEDYGPTYYESPEYFFFKHTQEESVTSYYHNLTGLANRVEGVALQALLACFISGLKKGIQRDIIPWKPTSIPKDASLEWLYEKKVLFKFTIIYEENYILFRY